MDPKNPDNEFGATTTDDLLDGVLLEMLNEDRLDLLVKEFFLDFIVFNVALSVEVKLEAGLLTDKGCDSTWG